MYGSFGTDERKGSKAIILLTPEETFSFPPKDAVVKAKKCKTSVIATCLPCGVAAVYCAQARSQKQNASPVSSDENEQEPRGYRRSEHHSEAPEDHATIQPFVIAFRTIAKYHSSKIRERCGVHHCGRNRNCYNEPRDSYRSCSEQWHR